MGRRLPAARTCGMEWRDTDSLDLPVFPFHCRRFDHLFAWKEKGRRYCGYLASFQDSETRRPSFCARTGIRNIPVLQLMERVVVRAFDGQNYGCFAANRHLLSHFRFNLSAYKLETPGNDRGRNSFRLLGVDDADKCSGLR